MNRSVIRYLFPLLILFGVVHGALAQTAQFSGQVSDPHQAMVSGAQIRVVNQSTGVKYEVNTNNDGAYVVPFVSPGTYRIYVKSQGFNIAMSEPLTVTTGQEMVFDVQLKVGSVEQTVTLYGKSQLLNTTDGSVSTIVDQKFVENIPLNGRSFQQLISAVPGAVYVPAGAGDSYGGGLTVDGQRTEENYFTLDGISLNAGQSLSQGVGAGFGAGYSGATPNLSALGTTQTLLSLDALQEFRGVTSTYDAEYGKVPGGQFLFTSRSGSNTWHGSGYDYFRNGALDANNWFNNYDQIPREAERQNDFGGTLGGPVQIPGFYNGADKTFFFFSYEGLRLMSPTAAQTWDVPSLSLRQQAPQTLQFLLDLYPKPNGSDFGDGFAPFTAGYSTPSSIDSSSIRVDHTFSKRLTIFGRYADSSSNTASRGTNQTFTPSILKSLSNDTKTATIGATMQLSSKLMNDLRFGFTKSNWNVAYALTDFGGASVPDLTTANPGYQSGDFFNSVLDWGGETGTQLLLHPEKSSQKQINVVDTMSILLGRHALKWGLDYRRTSTWNTYPVLQEYANFYNEASVLSDSVGWGRIDASPYSSINPVYMNFSAFAQDEWKVNTRLNLSLGLRWELAPAPTDADGHDPYTITQITDLATTVLAPEGTSLWKTTYVNFAPRIGMAYQLHQSQNHDTVLRAGFGVYYDTEAANSQGSMGYSAVGFTAMSYVSGSSFPYTQSQINAAGAPSTAAPYSAFVAGFDPKLKLPYTMQWSAALQQGLGQQQTLTLTYLGNGGRRLIDSRFLYPNNPAFGSSLILTANGSTAAYNAFQAQFQRKLSHGLQVLASYTWSHSIDDISSNFYVEEKMRASSDYDVRHNFQLAATYNIPGFDNDRFASVALGHWSLDTRISARSGIPVDIIGAEGYDSNGYLLTYHPNRVSSQPLYLYGSQYPGGRTINYAAFSEATDSSGDLIEGDAGRNAARGFALVQTDLALRKDFRLTERYGVQFRAEAFNIFNQGNFGDIYNQLSSGSSLFGQAYDTANAQLGTLNSLYQNGGPRSLQLALRVHF